MLTSIAIENFKGIGERVEIDLRPITLLFGANSAGKSSILHALHYAREVLVHRNLNASRTEIGGEHVDLGGFHGFVHRRELDRSVILRLAVNSPQFPDRAWWRGLNISLPESLRKWLEEHPPAPIDEYGLPFNQNPEEVSCEFTVSWDEINKIPRVSRFETWVNDVRLACIDLRSAWDDVAFDDTSDQQSEDKVDTVVLSYFNFEHPVLPRSLEWWDDDADQSYTTAADECASWFESGRTKYGAGDHRLFDAEPDGVMPSLGFGFSSFPFALLHDPIFDIFDDISPSRLSKKEKEVENAFVLYLDFALNAVKRAVETDLESLCYLGPLRKAYTRADSPPSHPDPSRWASGLAAWDLLQTTDEEVPDDEYDDEKFKTFIDEVSHWLSDGERLDSGYSLKCLRFKEVEVDVEPSSPPTAEELDLLPTYRRVDIISPDGLKLRPSDVGVGISQVLPVVVATLNQFSPGYELVAIEQPELHLHPRLQTRLGDLFIEGMKKHNHQFIIETHSEHLMLRLLRRIRESHDGELPEWHPGLSPDDLVVAYVQQDYGKVKVHRLRVDETGEFVERWPEGFFDERAEELF